METLIETLKLIKNLIIIIVVFICAFAFAHLAAIITVVDTVPVCSTKGELAIALLSILYCLIFTWVTIYNWGKKYQESLVKSK